MKKSLLLVSLTLAACSSVDLNYRHRPVSVEKIELHFKDVIFLPGQKGFLLIITPYQKALVVLPPAKSQYTETNISKPRRQEYSSKQVQPYDRQSGYGGMSFSFEKVRAYSHKFIIEVPGTCFAGQMQMQAWFLKTLPPGGGSDDLDRSAGTHCGQPEALAKRNYLKKAALAISPQLVSEWNESTALLLYSGAMKKKITIKDQKLVFFK